VETFKGSKVVVVGGAGFVGSNLVRLLLKEDVTKVTVIDNLMSAERVNIPSDSRVAFVEDSIASNAALARLEDGDEYIFHLATYHGNQSSIHDPIADHENNTITTLKLMNHCKNFKNLKRMVYSSAGCAAAEKTFETAEATTEDAPLSLVQDSPYSISKVIGEYYAVYFHRQHKLPTVRARFQNVYGPGEILGAGRWRGTTATVWRNVTPTFVYKALKGQPLPVQNNGVATRDFIFVEDICRGLMACALKGAPGDVYNIASGYERSILDLATTINEFTGNKGGIEYLPKRTWDNSGKRFGSTEKSRQQLGFEAKVDLKDGLARTVAWTRENLPLIERTIDKHAATMKT
jgi:UDP-glucose 4-epimerase